MKQINTNLIKVLSACLLLSLAVQCCAATTVSIEDVTADPGDLVIVPIMINDVTDYGTGTINITYDPSVVHITGVTSSSDSTVLASTISNVAGFTKISALNSGGASGDIVFANVEFTAIGTGSSPLDIDVVTLYDRSFNKIHETATVDNGLFTSGDVSTSPTPTPTTHSTSSSGGSTTGAVSISTPTPSPTPTFTAHSTSSSGGSTTGAVSISTPTPSPTPTPTQSVKDGADPVSTSESPSHNNEETDEETDTSGTTSPTVKPTLNSKNTPGFEAIFTVIGLMILFLILRRGNT